MNARLTWWLFVCLSFVLLGLTVANGFAAKVVERDFTFISLSLTIVYVFLTAWLGLFAHTHKYGMPIRWCQWFVDTAPQLGLIGTVIGLVALFGLDSNTAAVDEQAILSGVGAALFTTLVGAIWAAALEAQLVILRYA